MNLVGKIFTVLIFVMSLVFMAFTVMVYATHVNWQRVADNPKDKETLEHPLGLSQQLTQEKQLNQQLTEKNVEVNREFAMEKAEDRESRAKLETENDNLSQKVLADKKVIDDERKAANDAVAALKLAHETLAAERTDAETLRGEIKKAHEDRDASAKQVRELTDQLNSAVAERMQVTERSVQLAADLAAAKESLRYLGVDFKTDIKSKQPPHPLDGVVLAVPQQNLVEISIGADDGLRKGHKLEVVRMNGATAYVGRIEVTQTTPDRAVCRVLPEMLRSPMQRGDRVFDRLD
jgi:hypothetical protein